MNTFFVPPMYRYQVGDLLWHPRLGAYLVLSVHIDYFNSYTLITEDGLQYQTTTPPEFVKNTGMVYDYKSFWEAQRDFKAGFFIPYFKPTNQCKRFDYDG